MIHHCISLANSKNIEKVEYLPVCIPNLFSDVTTLFFCEVSAASMYIEIHSFNLGGKRSQEALGAPQEIHSLVIGGSV